MKTPRTIAYGEEIKKIRHIAPITDADIAQRGHYSALRSAAVPDAS
jgi:hypothetical protein